MPKRRSLSKINLELLDTEEQEMIKITALTEGDTPREYFGDLPALKRTRQRWYWFRRRAIEAVQHTHLVGEATDPGAGIEAVISERPEGGYVLRFFRRPQMIEARDLSPEQKAALSIK